MSEANRNQINLTFGKLILATTFSAAIPTVVGIAYFNDVSGRMNALESDRHSSASIAQELAAIHLGAVQGEKVIPDLKGQWV